MAYRYKKHACGWIQRIGNPSPEEEREFFKRAVGVVRFPSIDHRIKQSKKRSPKKQGLPLNGAHQHWVFHPAADAPFDLLREETTMNDILKKQLEKAIREAKKIIADPDHHVGYDWEASLEQIRTAKARRRGELPGQPTAKVLAFPRQKSNADDDA